MRKAELAAEAEAEAEAGETSEEAEEEDGEELTMKEFMFNVTHFGSKIDLKLTGAETYTAWEADSLRLSLRFCRKPQHSSYTILVMTYTPGPESAVKSENAKIFYYVAGTVTLIRPEPRLSN
ncbi:hypothetical protein GJ744_009956 [Endocarpon pusillum]|uniref:Uncharacterized protein n=1 Tax=Endocarpon pusillum TaxID=364733 RepID=A0A8H7AJ41_9EURO|nr:hypothetical protein GJ744_009956 [Endocarpon pusillum]